MKEGILLTNPGDRPTAQGRAKPVDTNATVTSPRGGHTGWWALSSVHSRPLHSMPCLSGGRGSMGKVSVLCGHHKSPHGHPLHLHPPHLTVKADSGCSWYWREEGPLQQQPQLWCHHCWPGLQATRALYFSSHTQPFSTNKGRKGGFYKVSRLCS